MSSHLPRKLFRIVSKATKPLFKPRNKAFLKATVEALQYDLMSLTNSNDIFVTLSGRSPQSAVKMAFKTGKQADINVLLSCLPPLLRFSRAIRVINEAVDAVYEQKSTRYSPFELIPGALLISRLRLTERELKEQDLSKLHSVWASRLVRKVRKEFEKIKAVRAGIPHADPLTSLELKKLNIFYLTLAIHNVIVRKNSHVSIDNHHYEYFLDRFMAIDGFGRADSALYSAAFSTLIHSLDSELVAYGVPFPRTLLLRIVPTQEPIKHRQSPATNKLSTLESIARSRNQRIRNLRRKLFTSPADFVPADRLIGNWLCSSAHSAGIEVAFKYDAANNQLQAFCCYPDGQPSELFWSIKVDDDEGLVQMDRPYLAEIHKNAMHYNDAVEMTPPKVASVMFRGLSHEMFGSKHFGTFPVESLHFEVYMSWMADVEVEVPRKASPEPQSLAVPQKVRTTRERACYFCRTTEMDWCLQEISHEGVFTIPALMYIDILTK